MVLAFWDSTCFRPRKAEVREGITRYSVEDEYEYDDEDDSKNDDEDDMAYDDDNDSTKFDF